MNMECPYSLKWRLVSRMVVLQVILLTLLMLLIFGVLLGTGVIPQKYEGHALNALKESVTRDPGGELVLKATPGLAELRSEVSNLWFVIRDDQGHRLSEGTVPSEFTGIEGTLDHISDARLGLGIGEAAPPAAVVRWVETAAGDVQIMAGTQGPLSVHHLAYAVFTFFLKGILPIALLMALATIVATQLVVRGALSGLGLAAAEAERIDIDQRGVRLPVANMPLEIEPLVKAVNDALDRLDIGYERHKRFLVDAAHELRTPIAILNTRLASLPATPDKALLLQDVARLTTLTDQLLDLQRLRQNADHFALVDLVAVGHTVVADLAPLAFSAGYDMAFEPEAASIVASGDKTSIERALTNLVQNAIEHGGRKGKITVSVALPASIEVRDEGEGIPAEEREKIFEPFYRLRPRNHGAGLGLNLVQEIMRLHGGGIELADGPADGAHFRMSFPAGALPGERGAGASAG